MMENILTAELAERIDQAEIQAHASRILGLRLIPGNPLHTEMERFGRAFALLVRGAPYYETDRVFGFGTGDEDQLDKILDWFAVREVAPHMDISPYRCDKPVLRLLTSRGLAQYNFLTVLYKHLGEENQVEPLLPLGVEIHEYGPRELAAFGEICAEIDGCIGEEIPAKARVVAAQFTHWRRYTASVDGVQAAHATLFIGGENAVMMYAATRSDLRGHGCQMALLQRRIADAARAGCSLLVCASYPGTTSQRNQMRAGLLVAYTKALWTVAAFPLPGGEGL